MSYISIFKKKNDDDVSACLPSFQPQDKWLGKWVGDVLPQKIYSIYFHLKTPNEHSYDVNKPINQLKTS